MFCRALRDAQSPVALGKQMPLVTNAALAEGRLLDVYADGSPPHMRHLLGRLVDVNTRSRYVKRYDWKQKEHT